MKPTSGDQPSLLIASEQVLERLFRAHYARWLADAKGRLGVDAAGAAPRVVSKAFHLAWTDRQRFHTEEELDAFLGANVQHGSARELSRYAGLHRMDAQKGAQKEAAHDHAEMGVDEAWDRLQHTLQGGAPDAFRKRASAARHEAAAHMAKIGGRSFNWKSVVGYSVAGLVITLAAVWYVGRSGQDRDTLKALNAQDVRSYATSSGQQAKVTLDDSTLVRLGPDSKLTVPKMFGIALRVVRIDGVANFEVTRTLKQSFEVRAGDVTILAHGTAFTVRRFKDDATVLVLVRTGSVDLRFGGQERNVAEGMSLMVTDSGGSGVPSSEQLAEASSWVDGNASIVGHTLREALPLLKRWYALNIKVKDTMLLDRKVFINAAMGSQRDAILQAEQSGGLKFTYIGQAMAFQDTVPGKPGARRKAAK